jgi:SRSO17 transposase
MKANPTVRYRAEFDRFYERFDGVFSRSESREQGKKVLRGLLAPVERKNGWQVAEAIGDSDADKTQRLMYQVTWKADDARNELQAYVIDELGDEDAVGIVDETGFLKKGEGSAGVQRQYSGTAGKIENCQIATFLAYASATGCVLIDRRLYLPAVWTNDKTRCKKAKIPETVKFQTKPEQAREMLQAAWERKVPMRWVTGDEVYGNAPELRDAIDAAGKLYVLAVSSTCPVRLVDAKLLGNAGQNAVTTAAEVLSGASKIKFERMAVTLGEKGPIIYDWAVVRIFEQVDKRNGRSGWLLIRRSVSDPSEVAFYLSNADEKTPCGKLAKVAATRFNIEMCFKLGKGETGLDQYEVRHYHSWYRHITLSMMALAWLVITKHRLMQVEAETSPKKTSRTVVRSRSAQAT